TGAGFDGRYSHATRPGQPALEPADYAENPGAKGGAAQLTLGALRDVSGYRLYYDLRRGWRITSPNLEQFELPEIGYQCFIGQTRLTNSSRTRNHDPLA